MKTINEVIISITNRCNLKCRMCDIPDIRIDELQTEQWKQVISDAALSGCHTIVFSGGEPLLRKDIFELIAFARANNMNACLTSNGTLIDKVCAQNLKQAKVNVVNISIEGTQATHDLLRGKGSYQKAVNALNELEKQGIEATVAATVSRYNFRELSQIAGITAQAKATTLRFQPFNSLFLSDKNKKQDFLISPEEKNILAQQIEDVIRLAAEHKLAVNPPAYLRMIPDYLASGNIAPSKGCEALWTSCPINAQGRIFACWVLAQEELQVGDLKKNRFNDIWDSPAHNRIRRQIIENTCSGCLMSCYDRAYAPAPSVGELINKAKKVTRKSAWVRQKNKIVQKVLSYKRKYSFYLSYRGSVKKIFVRGLNNIKRKLVLSRQKKNKADDISLIDNIQRAKQVLLCQRRKTQWK